MRKYALWGNLMAGGSGVEWYFGYELPHSDLNCEDWRSREKVWEFSRFALNFFQDHLPDWLPDLLGVNDNPWKNPGILEPLA